MDNELKTENVAEETAAEASTPQAEATENASQGDKKKKKGFKEKLGGFIFAAVIIVVYIAIAYGDDLKELNLGGNANDDSPGAAADYNDDDDESAEPVAPTINGMNFGVSKGEFVAWFEDAFTTELESYDDSDSPVFTAPHSCYIYRKGDESVLLALVYDDNKVTAIACLGYYNDVFDTIGAVAQAVSPGFDTKDLVYLTSGHTYTNAGLAVECMGWDLTGASNALLLCVDGE